MLHDDAIPDYGESREQASEYLRQIIAMLSQFAVVPNPINYMVLYDYLAGRDAELVAEMDRARQNGSVNDELTQKLFRRFMLNQCQDGDFEHLQDEVRRIVEETLQLLDDSGDQADRSSLRLENFAKQLATENDFDAVRDKVSEIVIETRLFSNMGKTVASAMQTSSRDIQLLQEELKRVRKEAERDALTGILNRGAFDTALLDTVNAQTTASLILLDVDLFKRINDNFGHLIGDKVIQFVAAVLSKNFKGKDTVARFGGDEFAVILPEIPADLANSLAEKVRALVEQSRLKRSDNGDSLGTVTLSIGVAALHKGDTTTDILARADEALYAAKKDGRNRVRVIS